MSETSYTDKVNRGLTGPNTCLPVCFPTCFERLSPFTLRDETYLAYIGYCAMDDTKGIHKLIKNRSMVTALGMIASDVGLDSWKDINFENVSSEHGFKLLIRKLVRSNQGIILDIDAEYDEPDVNTKVIYDPTLEPHGVGLLPLDEQGEVFMLASSWVPRVLQGPQRVEELYEHLIHQKCPAWRPFPFHDANISYFPL